MVHICFPSQGMLRDISIKKDQSAYEVNHEFEKLLVGIYGSDTLK